MMMVMMVEAVSVDEMEADESLEILEDDVSTDSLVRTFSQVNPQMFQHFPACCVNRNQTFCSRTCSTESHQGSRPGYKERITDHSEHVTVSV